MDKLCVTVPKKSRKSLAQSANSCGMDLLCEYRILTQLIFGIWVLTLSLPSRTQQAQRRFRVTIISDIAKHTNTG